MSGMVSEGEQRNRRNLRVVLASFSAGVGAMVMLGLVAPVAAQSALSVADAEAAPVASIEPAVAPLDLDAINADLAVAEQALRQSARDTDRAVSRLRRIAAQ